ncbi:hypothetical protein QBC38DRAFT_445605 [Podospora fimiseda]|uniref:Uncharacterized protein n=1 Tax=Podospora fimiseda TaxID=252190 RepID=A0AAN7BLI9_9PEZI|nr:hypothetical protein QBC38DRAFT_445605 [Podospora fimiseda]
MRNDRWLQGLLYLGSREDPSASNKHLGRGGPRMVSKDGALGSVSVVKRGGKVGDRRIQGSQETPNRDPTEGPDMQVDVAPKSMPPWLNDKVDKTTLGPIMRNPRQSNGRRGAQTAKQTTPPCLSVAHAMMQVMARDDAKWRCVRLFGLFRSVLAGDTVGESRLARFDWTGSTRVNYLHAKKLTSGQRMRKISVQNADPSQVG